MRSVDLVDTDSISRLIWKTVRGLTGRTDIDESVNFFELGMDSLQALQLISALRKNHQVGSLALSAIYHNPSALQLAQSLSRAATETSAEETDAADELLSRYRNQILQIPKAVTHLEREREREELIPFLNPLSYPPPPFCPVPFAGKNQVRCCLFDLACLTCIVFLGVTDLEKGLQVSYSCFQLYVS
ncbi:hypothetical protein F4808DRAFT_45005 [Astrocystis sublimbata]|nr:hypothetical protein F4808DRAFT_45005 [Astrocystis sublimbata]